ncbi:hypothetical protein BZG01_07000 [Labilibaculum manganireducens]|uniref:Uncharacterized protein n=1 Tax=Labilibaculum manganireducens TaxID=1940525 RepID=A0A2N3IAV2_9BACT|nr:hypothetical protein [Labilibaculum manganireducens]PKQ67482.1 hypothetical protein BZG01_07000 [Labilibaculum manganireducens]
MSRQTLNPFGKNRAEQMGEDSWRYYVSPEENLLSEQPLIFEGSRGTGKTMFLLCNSWREKFSEFNFENDKIKRLFSKENFVGIYYKVDGRFVGNNLKGKGVEDEKWVSIFNTYFNIVVSKEIYEFISNCLLQNIINHSDLNNLNSRVAKKIGLEGGSDIEKIFEKFEEILDSVEEFSNDPEQSLPKLLSSGTLIKTIVEFTRKIEIFKESRFHMLIDEYEELNENQQIQLNTLIKQSVYWLVYDVCVKTNGIYSFNTISGNEIIQEPHDFKHHKPELKDYDNSSRYLEFLKRICQKRLEEFVPKETKEYCTWINIENYLKRHSEAEILSVYKKSPNYKKEVLDVLRELVNHDESSKEIEPKEIERVLFNDSPLIERMHIALLRRKDINVKVLYEAIIKEKKEYFDWKHNTLFPTHFLLCNELGLEYQYHGLKVFAQLSSGVIRYFIEICKSAFDSAIENGFYFSNPRSFSLKEQTNAAQFVSETKVAQIDGFVPGGKVLKRLILNLGKIYYLRQTNKHTTLGEPEVNHFTTSLFELKTYHSDATKYLEFAIMHNILQPSLPTKTKSNDIVEVADFHINHIYCPFFKISHRRKRKINIEPSVLNKLILGNSEEVNKIIKKYEELNDTQISQGKLF